MKCAVFGLDQSRISAYHKDVYKRQAEAFWSYSPEMFFHLMYGGLFAIYVRFFPIRHFRLEQFLPILGIDVISNLTEIFVRLGTDALTTAVLLRLVIVGIGRTVLAVVLLASFDAYGLSIPVSYTHLMRSAHKRNLTASTTSCMMQVSRHSFIPR